MRLVPSTEIEALNEKASFQSTFTFFDVLVTLRSDSCDVIEFFGRLYGHFLSDRSKHQGEPLSYHILTKKANPEGPILLSYESMIFSLAEGASLAQSADTVIFNDIVSKIKSHLLIHGLSVSFKGTGLILSGLTGVGKTTLGLELIRRGIRFLSDELAALSRSSHLLHPFPRALCVRRKTINLFKELDGNYLPTMHHLDDRRGMLDIEKLPGESLGAACRPGYVILLTTEADLGQVIEDEIPILLALRKKDDALIFKLSEIPGVRYRSIFSDNGIHYWRFRVRKDRAVQREFVNLCEEHGDSVLSRVKAVEKTPEPGFKPRLIPIPKSVAALELFGNLQNVSFDGLSDFSSPLGTPPQILAELSAIVAKTECYRLVVGDLKRTADLVCELVF